MGFLDVLFPKKCVNCGMIGDFVCTRCFTYLSFDVLPICLICNRQTYTGLTHEKCRGKFVIDGAFSGIVFGKVAKKLVYRFKYRPYLHSLSEFMTELFFEGLIQNETFVSVGKAGGVLVPIPLHLSRLRERGYNQAQLLAKGLSTKLDLPLRGILVRVKRTVRQVTLDRSKRKENMKDAFALKEEEFVQGETIFLVDDVLTSGATLSEAASILKRAGAKRVFGLTLAHGQ